MPHTKFHRGKRAGRKHRSRRANLARDYPHFFEGVEGDTYKLSYRDHKACHRYVAEDTHGKPGVKTYTAENTSSSYWAAPMGFAFEDIMQNILTGQRDELVDAFNNINGASDALPEEVKLIGRILMEHGIMPGELAGIEYTAKIQRITQPAAVSYVGDAPEKQSKTDLAIIARKTDGTVKRIGISQKNSKMSAISYHSGNMDRLCDAIVSEDREKIRSIFEAIAVFGKDDFLSGRFYSVLGMQAIRSQLACAEDGVPRIQHDIEDALGSDISSGDVIQEYVAPLFRKNLRAILKPVISGKGFSGQRGIETADYVLKRNKDTGEATLKTIDGYIEELEQYEGTAPTLYDGFLSIPENDGITLPFALRCTITDRGQKTIKVQLPTMF